MKKKAIEKIPFLTLQKVSRKKNVKYIGVTAFRNIAHERHLFLEIYKNSRETKNVPIVRIVLTKKDFGNFFPEKGEWSRQKIEIDNYRLLWQTNEESRDAWKQTEEKNILLERKDLDRIKKCCTEKVWREERWWEYVYKHENNITFTERRKVENRRYERRKQALKDRAENTPELPKKKILDRADALYFSHKHFLYYKKRGCRAQIACTKCGGVTDGRWKESISYESQFQHRVEEPREGKSGKCPMCGEYGEYKCQGKVKGKHSRTIHVFLGQKYKETGLVLRYIEVSKEWKQGLICGDNGPEMFNASEKLSGVEIARTYFEEGKESQTDYHKYNWYSEEDFWDDCNLYGMANITIDNAPVMRETYDEMQGTIFQYSAMKEYAAAVHGFNPKDYLERYQHLPQIEMLVKLNLIGVVSEIVRCRCGIISSQYANRPDVFLGIRKERVKLLAEQKGDTQLLKAMKTEKRMEQNWTDVQLKQISETRLDRGQIELATEYMGIQQLLNRISKYAHCEYGTRCSNAEARIQQVAGTYADYLSMRIALGYDLRNTVYQQPRNLEAAHEKMVLESNKQKIEKRLAEVARNFPMIRKNYRKLRSKYFYEDEKFLIRPARSAEEIVIEGRVLHHCVGGDGYLGKHNNGETYILMLRLQEDKETPYITVEIRGEKPSIIQWYGAHDKKPDEKNIQKWLDDYVTRLKTGTLKADNEAQEKRILVAV